jgi:FKBP-type peptidyl-prolyl cis-trans isomerase
MGVENECGVYVRYSVTDLKNNYNTTTREDIAKQLGTYAKSTYYGPVLWETGYNTIIEGVEEALMTMRVGGKIKVIVPSWMSKFGYDGSNKEHVTTTIYEIEVLNVIKDLKIYLADTLSAFNSRHWGVGMDTTSTDYYFKKLKSGEDTLKVGDAVSIWYVGKLLDGYVFDTNIEDTARKYGIYSSSKTYTALEHTLADTTSTSDDSVVKGFEISLWRMSHGGEGITFFSPSLGYGSESKAFGIYQPLFFYIKVEKE